MSNLAKILSLSYDSAFASKSAALKVYYRSVRLIKISGVLTPLTVMSSIYTNVLLCGNCIDYENRNLYVFYVDTNYGAAWIIEINIDSRVQNVVYYDRLNNIGFNPEHKIYNARVVHGRLVWTDNNMPIYQMDIERAKRSFYYNIGYGQYPNTSEWSEIVTYGIDEIVSDGNNFYKSLIDANIGIEPKFDNGTSWRKLCLIEDAYYSLNIENFYFEAVPPKHPPVVEYLSDDSRKINNLRQTLFQFAYRYVYMDWRKSTFSPASIVPVPQAEEETATGLANEQTSLNNKFKITVNSGGEEVRAVEIIARSSDDPSKWYLIETINKFEEEERGSEISRIAYPANVELGIAVMAPVSSGDGIIGSILPSLGMTLPTPTVIVNTITASAVDFNWLAAESGVAFKQESTITIVGGVHGTLIIKPSWITVRDGTWHGMMIGDEVHDGETIDFFPTDSNYGPALPDAPIAFRDSTGNIVSIIVSQDAVIVLPVASVVVGDMESFTISNIVVGGLVIGAVTIDVSFNHTSPGNVWKFISISDGTNILYANTGDPNGIYLRIDGSATKTLIPLSRALVSGDVLTIQIGLSIV